MTAPLDYAPPTPWHRRRKPRRATILVAILLGLAITTYFYGPGVYRRASILYWQHRCMTFDNSALAPVSFPVAVGSLPPAELEALSSAWGDRALANDLTRGYYYRDIVFVHRLHGPAGDRLLIASIRGAAFARESLPPRYAFMPIISYRLISPGSLFGDPELLFRERTAHIFPAILGTLPAPTFTASPGNPDPSDGAAFTIPFYLDGTRHEACFRLNATCNDIELVSITPAL